MENYKDDIIATRTGNVGSSDSKMLQQIAELGQVPTSSKKRLAIVKGFCENPNITTPAMRLGDYVEQMTFESLHSQDARWESNKFLKSEKYSRKNCGCITHIDYWLQDDDKKVITIGEQKATVHNYQQAYDEYKFQIYHHYLLTKEYANKIGYKVNVLFCVYNTNGIEEGHEYDPSRLTVRKLRMLEKYSKSYHLSEAMDIIDNFLETFTEYYEDEVDGNLLPEKVKTEFDQVTTFLAEIKEREKKVEDFKKKLTEFMISKGVKAIKTDAWAITLVNESESVSVDYKAIFANEIEAKKPRIANKLKKQYKKVTKKKAYIKISIRENEAENGL